MTRVNWTNCIGGLLLLVLGLFFVFGSFDLSIGSARRMGPGYFPLVVGSIVSILAACVVIKSLFEAKIEEKLDYRSFAAIAAGIAAFAFLTPIFGVVPAVFVSVLSSSFADSRLTLLAKFILAVGVSLAVWIVFVLALQLPFVPFKGF